MRVKFGLSRAPQLFRFSTIFGAFISMLWQLWPLRVLVLVLPAAQMTYLPACYTLVEAATYSCAWHAGPPPAPQLDLKHAGMIEASPSPGSPPYFIVRTDSGGCGT